MINIKNRKLQKIISENRWLMNELDNINPNSFEIQKIKFIDQNLKNKFSRLLREFKMLLLTKENWWDLLNDSPRDFWSAFKTLGFTKINDKWLTPYQTREYISYLNSSLQSNGYVLNPFHIIFKNKIFEWEEIIFKSEKGIIMFLLMQTKLKRIKIDYETIDHIKNNIGFGIKNIRALSATLEREIRLSKVGPFEFVVRKKHEQQIAKELFCLFDKNNFNFLNKEQLLLLLKDISEKYNLVDDEPYYILKRYYGNKKIFFTTGNQMSISFDKRLVELSSKNRLKEVLKIPSILTKFDLGVKVGLNEFALVNQKTIKSAGKDFLYFDKDDKDHIEHLICLFNDFPPIKDRKEFFIKDFKIFCEFSKDIFLKKLGILKNVSQILNDVYKDKLIKTNSYPNKYIIENEKIKSIKFIDENDWSDFN